MLSKSSALLYANPESNPEPAVRVSGLPRPGRDAIRALLVESDPFFTDELCAAARRSNQLDFRLIPCRSLAQAEMALSRRPFDVIFVDYWLGEETSVAFIHRLSVSGGAPCVMVTSLDEPDIRRIAFRAGARAFLSRDALNAQLLDSVTMTVLRPRFLPPN